MTEAINGRDLHRTASALLGGLVDDGFLERLKWQAPFQGIALDSRSVTRNSLFLAVPGGQVDGRRFCDDALASGASLIVFERDNAPRQCMELERSGQAVGVTALASQVSELSARFFGRPSENMQVIGVTGTNGKTHLRMAARPGAGAPGSSFSHARYPRLRSTG